MRWPPAPHVVSRTAVAALLLGLLLCAFLRQAFGWSAGEWLHLVPDCAFRALTGFPCPGCGMSRALLLLTELRFADALAANPAAPALVSGMAAWLARPSSWQASSGWQARLGAAAAPAALVVVLLAWTMRCLSHPLRLPL